MFLAVLIYNAVRQSINNFYYVAILWILFTIGTLWFGNRYIIKFLNNKYPWTRFVTKRFLFQVLLSLLYSLFIINANYYLFKRLFLKEIPDIRQFFVLNIYGLLLIVPIVSINFGVIFLTEWKKSVQLVKELEKENLQSQFQSLRSHIDPHFLFNNLNILSTLIKDKDAIEFLNNFADIYRYLLNYKGSELVELSKEMNALTSYFFILNKRYADGLRIKTEIPEFAGNKYVLPLTIQMLIENAVKHNAMSHDEPLSISIGIEEDKYLVVQNNIQPKEIEKSRMTPTGLKNIKNRYQFYIDLPVEVINNSKEFIVKLPLIENEG